MAKYSLTCPGKFATSQPWFVLKWTMVYYLWTWVLPSTVTSCEHLKAFLLL
jgi:hypothetical protein